MCWLLFNICLVLLRYWEWRITLFSRIQLYCRLTILCLFMPALCAHADELLMLTHDFPPYNFRNDGMFVGINTEIITQVLKQENIPYKIENINWARAQKIVQSTPNTALLSAGRSKVREDKYAWIGPLVSSGSFLYKLTSRSDIKVDSFDDLKRYRIAITRSGVMVDKFQSIGLYEPKNLLLLSKATDTYRALFRQRADFIIGSDLTTPYNLRALGYDLSAIEAEFEVTVHSVRNYLAVHKDFSPELIERCNKLIGEMEASGEIQRIIEKYRLRAGPLPKS